MKKLYVSIVALFLGYAAFAQTPTMSFGGVIGGAGGDVIQSICNDASGNVYVGGYFSAQMDFDPGAGTVNRTPTAGGSDDGFIVKYNSTGTFQWVVTFGSTGDDAVIALVADASGVYATGYFVGSVNFNAAFGTAVPASFGGEDIFYAKFAAGNGANVFVNSIGSSLDDYGYAIALDASSSIYLAGSFQGTVDFDPAGGTPHNEVSWGDLDMFLAKYNSSGAYVWSLDVGSNGDDVAKAVYVGANNDVWVGGFFTGDFFYSDPNDFNTKIDHVGGYDGYFGRYDAGNGSLLWDGYVQSTGDDEVTSLWADAASIYTGGYFSETAEMFGSGGTSKSVAANGLGIDGFVTRHNPSDMTLEWMNTFGSTNDDYVNWIVGDGGSVYAVGGFSGTMDVDPSATVVNLTNTTGTINAFSVKYNYLNGAHVNSFAIGGTDVDVASSAMVNVGYYWWTGGFKNTVDIDPGATLNSKASAGDYDSFFARFTPPEPSTSITGLAFHDVGSTTYNYSFNNTAYPDGYLTLVKVGSAPTGAPVDGITYTAGATLGDASVLYVGPETSIYVTQATPGAQLYFSIYPYNGSGTTTNYRLTTPASGNITMLVPAAEPGFSPTNFQKTNVGSSSYTVTFQAATNSPSGYIAIRSTGALPNTDPTDGVTYTAGATIGNSVVAFVGGLSATAGTTVQFSETGMNASTTYNYKIYAFNGTGGAINYRQTLPLQGNVLTSSNVTLAPEPTAQPTNLVFSHVLSTKFDFDFTASTSANVSGYLGVRSTGAPTTFVPQDGVEYNAGDYTNAGVNEELITLIGPGTSWGYSVDGTLTPNTTYYFTIFAYNGDNETTNYLTTNPLSKSQKTLLEDPTDITGPTIVDNSPTSSSGNTTVKITATITDTDSGVASAYIEYYPVNADTYGYKDMVNTTGNKWEATIESSFNTEVGVEYKIYASDDVGNMSSSPAWKTVVVQTSADGLTIPFAAGSAKENYRIISIPLDLAKKSVSDVFGDDLGEYDKSKYRLFRYANGATTELTASSSLETGKGYWFIAADSKTVDTGAGTTVNVGISAPFYIPITIGWNQIGNPFNADVNWASIKNHDDNTDKTFGDFKGFNGSFATLTQLKKMSGGFVMIQGLGDGKLRIPAFESSGGRESAPLPPVNFAQTLGSDTWGVDLVVKSGSVENTFAGFGMHPDAKEQNDKYDDFTLPRFLEYLELNYNKQFVGSSFTKDIVPTSTQHVWEFEVASNVEDDIVELRWDNSYFGNTPLQLVLWDVEQQRAIDMKAGNNYTFERNQSGSFKIFFGDEAFVKMETQPSRVVFHSASPVPSSGNVTFAFSLPEGSSDVNTNLVIYNLMGQKVANLVNGPLPTGYQQAVWNIEDGTKHAAGVYISVLKFGNTTLQKRLIIR